MLIRAMSLLMLLGLLAACVQSPTRSTKAEGSAPAQSEPCKTTRNIQPPGPQAPQHPPRCKDSFDAGKLPASVLPPIVLP